MNMEVQSTERIQQPQLLKVACDIFGPAVLRPAWCSLVTISIVRVQDPRVTSAFPVSSLFRRYNGTFLRTFDTLPERYSLLFLLLELMFVYIAVSEITCAAA